MIRIEDLLEAGVHFGHRVTKWNPRMAPFIFGERNGIHIIDLIQTLSYLEESSKFLQQLRKTNDRTGQVRDGVAVRTSQNTNRNILFVGTKKQASALVELCSKRINNHDETAPQDAKSRLGVTAHFVNHRWLGGLLTNWSTMRICIDQLNKLEKREENGELQNLPKKERSILKKQYEKLDKFFGGIKTMKQRPDLVIIVGQDHEMNAVRECNKLARSSEISWSEPVTSNATDAASRGARGKNSGSGVDQKSVVDRTNGSSEPLRTITLLDTNCDPALADIFIPANDDSTKSLELILGQLTEVLCES